MSKRVIFLLVCAFSILNVKVINIWAHDTSELCYAPGELLVRFVPKSRGIQLNTKEKNMILSYLGGATIEHNFKIVPGLSLVKLPEDQKVEDVLQSYNLASEILYAEPNYKLQAFANEPNDTYFDELWGLHKTGQTGGIEDADIDAPESWDIATNVDPNIIVAVIDSGVDYTHPDLADNMWINPIVA